MLGIHASKQMAALRDKLIDSNSRSVFVNAHPQNSLLKIDFRNFANLSFKNFDTKHLNKFLSDPQFKISIPIASEILSKQQRKCEHLYLKNEELKNEYKIDSLGFGYPLILIKNTKKKNYQLMPLFIWAVKAYKSNCPNKTITYHLNKSEIVTINPSIIRYIKSLNGPNLNDLFLDGVKNNKIDLLAVINKVLNFFEEPLITNSFFDSPLIKIPEKLNDEFFISNPSFIHNGVFGLYSNSKEAIILDYIKLEENTIPCHFKPLENTNKTYFSGISLDHSQQRIIRSLLNQKNSIIHGPPGTGKSKTITAIINYALSKNQTSLLVCQKKTAMDVIYTNLKELGLAEFVVKITDVKKDRRNIINKARSIIDKVKKGRQNIFDLRPTLFEINSRNKSIIDEKIKRTTSTIDFVSRIKKQLDTPLLDHELSYSDLVIKIKKNNKKKLSSLLGLKSSLFSFSKKEFDFLKTDLHFVNHHLKKNINPYRSYLPFLNEEFLKKREKSLLKKIANTLFKSHHHKISNLIALWHSKTKSLSSFELKYFNYVESDNSDFKMLFESFNIHKNTLLKSKIFNSDFVNILQRLEPISQLKKLNEALFILKEINHEFESIVEFYNYRSKLSFLRKNILTKACEIEEFEKLFFNWYFINLLDKNHIPFLDFNGFENGYLDIVEDVEKINSYYSTLALTNCRNKRNRSISSFESKSFLSLEQFFAKKSTSLRMKLPLHKITSDSSKIFRNFFPIVIANPGVCSQLFPMEKGFFDYVIFDESSQLRFEDTFPSLLRGKTVIVSGDTNQLPPSNYFNVNEYSIKKDSISKKTKENNNLSLLDVCIDSTFKEHYLDIHYRSMHPDLIQFSNHAFYQKRLIPLPPKKDYCSIEFREINGIYNNRLNLDEAKAIVDYIEFEASSNEEIGVATFSLAQQNKVLLLIEKRTLVNKKFHEKINLMIKNGFFVKNIENIQGEERRLILIGTTYGINNKGKFNQFFGPLNTTFRGHKLLNVIITRAIHKMIIFTSIPQEYYMKYDLILNKNGFIGKGILYSFLAYAKAISSQNLQLKEDVLNKIFNSTSKSFHKKKYNKNDLLKFSNSLRNELCSILGIEIFITNNYSLGGFNYEIKLEFDSKYSTILVDINGKKADGKYENYLFDIQRCKVAQTSGFNYYRLWLSNYYNNPKFEIQNIIKALNII